MGKLVFVGIVLFVGLLSSCNDKISSKQQKELDHLNEMFSEIQSLASSENCDNSAEWAFTAYGSKACGGPIGYIAYSTNINTVEFLQKVEEHRVAQEDYNEKWGIFSDCAIVGSPIGVNCENGAPVLVY